MTCGPHKPLLSYLVGLSQTIAKPIYSDNKLQIYELDKLRNQNKQESNKQQLYKPIEQTTYNSLTNQNKNNKRNN